MRCALSSLLLAVMSLVAVAGCASNPSGSSAPAAARAADLDRLAGPPWAGTLTYLDYASDQRTTIPVTLEVARVVPEKAGGGAAWSFAFNFSEEPEAAETMVIALSPDGAALGDEMVVERAELPGGAVRIVTVQESADNNRPARLRQIYTLDDQRVSVVKMVRYTGETDELERNRFELSR